MDDYMREMMDLKSLVTKTLEKKGVLARIRAELRANVFAAIEEQDRASEGEDAAFALLGGCNERAKKLHNSATGKLLSSLVLEYLEWCELDHTAKVYLPECNLSRGFSRSELEEKLGLKHETEASRESDSRPLLLEVLESFLKTGVATPSSSKAANMLRSANRGAESAAFNDPTKDSDKAAGRSSASLLGNLPPLRRPGGLTPIGTARGNSSSIASSNSSDSGASVASRDSLASSVGKKEDVVRRDEGNQRSVLKTAEGGRVGKEHSTSPLSLSQSKFAASLDTVAIDAIGLDDDTASEDNASRHSNVSNQQLSSKRREVSGESAESRSLSASSSLRKKSSSAYFYSDSEDDVSLDKAEYGGWTHAFIPGPERQQTPTDLSPRSQLDGPGP